MVQKKKPAAKKAAATQWEAKTFGEFKPTDTVAWKAQRSVSPDGDVFFGVKQFVTTKAKGEIPGRMGITFLNDANCVEKLDNIIELLQKVRKAAAKEVPDDEPEEKPAKKPAAKKAAPAKKVASKKAKDEEDEPDEDADYVLVRNANEYLVRASVNPDTGKMKVRTTNDSEEAQLFKLKYAQQLLKKLSSVWSIQEF